MAATALGRGTSGPIATRPDGPVPSLIAYPDDAGEVAAVGDGVTRFAVGDRVIGCFHPRWSGGPIKPDYLTDRLGANLGGMLAEYAIVREEAAETGVDPVAEDERFRRLLLDAECHQGNDGHEAKDV